MKNQDCLHAKNITFGYPERIILTGINLSLSVGKIHGLVGPNGSGKTTSIKILSGLIKPDAGKVHFNQNVATVKDFQKIGLLLEGPPLYEQMRARHFLKFLGEIYQLKGRDLKDKISSSIESLKLNDFCDRPIRHLSKGQRQRVGLAGVLMGNPRFLILDEPLVGLDPESLQQFLQYLLSLKKECGILISSHQLHEVSLISDEVSFLNQGRIKASGNPNELHQSLLIEECLLITLKHWKNEYKEKFIQSFPKANLELLRSTGPVQVGVTYSKGVMETSEIVSFFSLHGGLEGLEKNQQKLDQLYFKLNQEDEGQYVGDL